MQPIEEEQMPLPEQQEQEEPIMPPQDAGELAPNQQPVNPFDTSGQESELSQLQGELEQSTSAIDNNFAEYYAENMPDEVEELFFEDKVQFLLEVEKAKQSFIEEKIAPLQQRASELEQSIAQNKQGAAIWEAQTKFSKAYPDADLDSLLKFYNEELSPKQKQSLETEGDLFKAYEKVYHYMQGGSNEDERPSKRNLPKQTKSQFGSPRGLDLDLTDSDLPINRR